MSLALTKITGQPRVWWWCTRSRTGKPPLDDRNINKTSFSQEEWERVAPQFPSVIFENSNELARYWILISSWPFTPLVLILNSNYPTTSKLFLSFHYSLTFRCRSKGASTKLLKNLVVHGLLIFGVLRFHSYCIAIEIINMGQMQMRGTLGQTMKVWSSSRKLS